jgi:SAM-dependent methyltransferase
MMHILRADGLASAALARSVQEFAERHASPGRAVLDLGCGTMPYRSMFTACGARYLGADISGSPDILIEPEGPIPVADDSIDIVVSFQVLEHVRDVPAYLSAARRVLRGDGRLFLSTHGVWPYHPHPTDFWRWTQDGLRITLETAGFRIDRVTALCGPAAWIPMFPLLACKKLLDPLSFLLAPVNVCVNLFAGLADRMTPAGLRDSNAAIYAIEASRTP